MVESKALEIQIDTTHVIDGVNPISDVSEEQNITGENSVASEPSPTITEPAVPKLPKKVTIAEYKQRRQNQGKLDTPSSNEFQLGPSKIDIDNQ